MFDPQPIEEWLSKYVRAWSTDDRAAVAALFTQDARYFTAPYAQPLVGQENIADWWVAQGESSLKWTFGREVLAGEGGLYVVRGTTNYLQGTGPSGRPERYHNLWLVTLDERGQAGEFVDYWMLEE